MGTALSRPVPTGLTPADLRERVAGYVEASRAEATRRAYASDWRSFDAWCDARGACPLPADPNTVLAYLTDRAASLRVSSLARALSAIREAHREADMPLDTSGRLFRAAWAGLRRTHGARPVQKAPATTAVVRAASYALPDTLAALRDRALLLIGFAGALRRSELVGLEAAERPGASWVERTRDGLVLHLARTKTDQEGQGADVGVPYGSDPDTCPVRALAAWLEAVDITAGPVFRGINRHGSVGSQALTPQSAAIIIRAAVERAALAEGMSPEAAKAHAARFSGHSLRAGLATAAAEAGVAPDLIQRQLRHADFSTTAGYIRRGQLLKRNAASMVGL